MRSRIIALALLAVLSAGCASTVRYVYIKTGTTAVQRDQDESECTRWAMINGERDPAWADVTTPARVLAARREATRPACMAARTMGRPGFQLMACAS